VDERNGDVWGVVYAAGYGRRFGGYKQFERIGAERLVDRCVRVLRAVCDGVVVVLPPELGPDVEPLWTSSEVGRAVPGGETNPDSVRAGVLAVPSDARAVVLHSPSHPLTTATLTRRVLHALDVHGADLAIPSQAIHDVLGRVDDGAIVARIDKQSVQITQMPMAFRAASLRAIVSGSLEGTDALSLSIAAGRRVVTVAGDPFNLHVTTPLELEAVRALAPLADAADA
jgi:2-C-methyl-D-erythritol 4-phosphate cytidylyltransferase